MKDSVEEGGDVHTPLNLSRNMSPCSDATHSEEESRLDAADINDQIDEIGFGKFQVIAAATFVLFAMSDGMELVVTNVAWRDLPREDWDMDSSFRAIFVSVSFLGFLLGAFVGGFVGDLYGRKIILYAHGMIFIPASILSALSQDKYSLMALRFCVGFSMGLVLPTCVSLMTEFSPSKFRARSVVLIPGIAYCVGQALVLFVGICLIQGYHEPDCHGSCGWWRGMMVAGVFPSSLALLLTYLYLPESPRYLLIQGRLPQVRVVLHHIASLNGVEFDTKSQASIGLCSSLGRSTRPLPPGHEHPAFIKFISEFLSAPTSSEVTIIVSLWCLLGCSVFGQSFLYPILLEADAPAGTRPISSVEQFWLLIMVTLVEVPGIPLAIFLMEHPHVGLRLAIAGFALASLGAAAFVCVVTDHGRFWIHLGNLALRFFSIVPYEIMYVYAAETLPTSHRNSGVSMGNAATKGVAMVVPLLLLPLLQYERHLPFVVMGLAAALAAVIALVFAREPPQALKDVQAQTPRTRAGQWASTHGAAGALYVGMPYHDQHDDAAADAEEHGRGRGLVYARATLSAGADSEQNALLDGRRGRGGRQVYGTQGGGGGQRARASEPGGDAPSVSDGDAPADWKESGELEDSSSGHGSLGSGSDEPEPERVSTKLV